MEKLKFFVRFNERMCADPNEVAAMMRHRLKSIEYQQKLHDDGKLVYGFKEADDLSRGVLMYEVDGLYELDLLQKRDPLWPYCHVETQPVLGTEHMSREIEDFIGERILNDDEYAQLEWPARKIDPAAEYWLAWKIVPPFSPLMTEEAQHDVYRRTVISQRAHQSRQEFNDENPVGKSVGILVYEGTMEDMLKHVTHCDVYRDSEIEFTSLATFAAARAATATWLRNKGWPVDEWEAATLPLEAVRISSERAAPVIAA